MEFSNNRTWIALHCVSMSISTKPPSFIGSVSVFLCTRTFLWFHKKLWIFFLIFWIICSGGLSTYAKYHTLLNMFWFIRVFFPIILYFFLTFSRFSSYFTFVSGLYVYPKIFILWDVHLKPTGFVLFPLLEPSHIPINFVLLYLISVAFSKSLCFQIFKCVVIT